MISCRDLTRHYDGVAAVAGLTFDVPAGGICAFLGPNGAGKSTTVKMLAGLLPPSSGEAIVAGFNVSQRPAELKSRIGVLPEGLGLFDDLTVEEHLLLTGPIYGLTRAETSSRAAQLLRILDLEHARRRFAISCSHGMRKRTALAMALLPNPQVLLLDEPFEAVDPVGSKTIQTLLATAAQRATTIFLATHVLPAVERLATQFLLIRNGRLAWSASAEEPRQSLEEHFFELVEAPMAEELNWLGWSRS